jgi:hypothetical protein
MESEGLLMPIPRTWSEELVSEWLCLKGYSTEIGLHVGTGVGGGRAEADVVGIRINTTKAGDKVLEIYHVEIGQLGGYDASVDTLKKKFSGERVSRITTKYKERMAVSGTVNYRKLYIDIWKRPLQRIKRLLANPEINRARIVVWTPREFFPEILDTIRDWDKSNDESTLPESLWMLKLLESLMWNTDFLDIKP